MGDAKRWAVTYTRHLKQKRKVYQDGAIELHVTCGKLMLYDDLGKLLESRFLNKDEVVESGGTLEFDNHLVDIGETERNYKPLTDLNAQGRDRKSVDKAGVLGQEARSRSSIESKTMVSQNIGASQNHPNVTHNTIRVHKKGELHSFGATQTTVRGNKQTKLQNSGVLQNHPNATQTTVREWHSLYTTQITQKAKKYHDGILRLSFCGSHGKQVFLYDDCGKLLDSRFLKKDEMVESGLTLAFVAHLVEIGEPKELCKPLKDVDPQVRESKTIEKNGMEGQKARNSFSAENKRIELQQRIVSSQSCPDATQNHNYGAPNSHLNITDTSVKEWHALYTTQITQKAKKYHDGILQLSCCGSHGKQVILLSGDGNILSSKYIISSEHVRTGSTYELPSYLVDIGEPRTSRGGNLKNDTSSGPVEGSNSSSSNFRKFTSGGKAPRNKLLRDACQILSILKKPIAQESLCPRKLRMEQAYPSQSSDLLQSSLQGTLPGHKSPGIKDPKRNAEDNRGDDFQNNEEESTTKMRSDLLQFRAAQVILSSDFTNLMDPEYREELPPDSCSASSNAFPGAAASGISKTKLDGEYIDKSTTHQDMPIDSSQVSVIITCDSPEDDQIHRMKPSTTPNSIGNSASRELPDCSNENVQVQKNLGLTSSESKHHLNDESISADSSSEIPESCGGAVQIIEDVKDEIPNQVCVGNMEPDYQRLDEASFLSGSSLSFSGPSTHDATNTEKERSEEFKTLSEKSMDMDDFPSFDLGI
ncbi:uncharacterized protein LOC131241170 isoform X2 [Magnolia sinica]|uniref:uncharacterized protein LOC131241170 isoform X2 n=1 Tax=Magnolia sinica TaxID=86752 RepID=UPI00265A6DDA|nr:uncharacterized protein LOC131241170 isoform X2 [Magnolia sinica]